MDTADNLNDQVVGIFRPGMASADRLIKTTVGRQDLLEDLLGALENQADKTKKQHFVFVGPRGIGKTHFLKLIEIRVSQNPVLKERFQIIRFPEENYRILSFADFLLGIIEILGDETGDPGLKDLFAKLEEEEDDTSIIDKVIPCLKRYKENTGKNLLVLLENLDMIFREQLKLKKNEKSVHQFRKFLMETPCINFIGTSPVHFEGFDDANHPLYDFFDIQVIEEFSKDQTIELIKKNLLWDNKADLLADFDSMIHKILALHEMTGGNARLIMILYNLIGKDNILEVKKQFEILLDRISPFYQDRIKDLAPQERALLETMALMRRDFKTPAKVALKMRKSQQQVSSLLKRMLKSGYLAVSDHPEDRRSKVYRIKEGFFDLWLAMSQSRVQRKRLPYLVDFFAGWYGHLDDREKKRCELWDLIEKDRSKAENSLQVLDYLSEVGTDDEKAKTKLEQAFFHHEAEDNEWIAALMDETCALTPKNPVLTWMKDQTRNWITGNDPAPDIVEQMKRMVDYWRYQRAGDFEEMAALAMELGTGFSQKGLHELNIAFLQKELPAIKEPAHKLNVLKEIAASQMKLWALPDAEQTLKKALDISRFLENMLEYGKILNLIGETHYLTGQYKTALNCLGESLEINQAIGDRRGEGTVLNNIGQIYYALADYEKALSHFETSLNLSKEVEDNEIKSTALNNIGQIYESRGDYQAALKYLEESLKISQDIGDREGEGRILNNISQIFKVRGNHETAINYLMKSLKISQEAGDRYNEGTILNNMSALAYAKGDCTIALTYAESSLKISQEIGDRRGEGNALNNIGQIYSSWGDHESALKYFEKSLKISHEIGDRPGEGTTLNNMSLVAFTKGEYEGALNYLRASLKISQEVGNKSGEGTTLNNMSGIASVKGDYETALKYLENSLKISLEIGNKRIEAAALNNISQISDSKGDYKHALEYLKRSLKICQEMGDRRGEGTAMNNISHIYYSREDYKMALKYVEGSLKISQEIGDRSGEGTIFNNISQIYDSQGDYETALKYLEESLKIHQAIGDQRGMAAVFHNMSHISLKNGDIKAGLTYSEKSYALAKETEDASALYYSGRHLGRLLCEAGQIEKGLELLKQSRGIGEKAGIPDHENLISIIEKYES